MKFIEFVNPHPHSVQLTGPDKAIKSVRGYSKIILPEWYQRYVPKYLKTVRAVPESDLKTSAKTIELDRKYTSYPKVAKPRAYPHKPRPKALGPVPSADPKNKNVSKKVNTPRVTTPRNTKMDITRKASGKRKHIVGKQTSPAEVKRLYTEAKEIGFPISDNIGIGILSYNRLGSLQRLIYSIRKFTNLDRTTIFVSDESDKKEVKDWLQAQDDIVLIDNTQRLGVAGQSNRLLKCLDRFRYGFLLNDDVEILKRGWTTFYTKAFDDTQYNHFCFRQPGIYGASPTDGKSTRDGRYAIRTIAAKPHGAVMAFTNIAFKKVGYFDESLGLYGMEHVDWSNRVALAGLNPPGFHDIEGSSQYFMIHKEKSAMSGRTSHLHNARQTYDKHKDDKSRIYVGHSKKIDVPSVSYIIPFRDINRTNAIQTVIDNVRAQRWPVVEIIIVEQDNAAHFKAQIVQPVRHYLAGNRKKNQPFNKSVAINMGVAKSSHNHIILQDADIILPWNYTSKMMKMLRTYESAHMGANVVYLNAEDSRELYTSKTLSNIDNGERAVSYFEGGSLGCRKNAFIRIGGFNEDFEGYGVEDCDFYDRLSKRTHFESDRTEVFLHLWHGRTKGWQALHRQNKTLFAHIKKTMTLDQYVDKLRGKYQGRYGS